MKKQRMVDEYKQLEIFKFADVIKTSLGTRKNGVLFGSFGSRNAGDDAILAGQILELRKLRWKKLTVVARYPSLITKMRGLSALSYFQISNILLAIIKSDFVIFGGGGLICKNRSGIKGLLFQLYMMLMFLFIPLLLQKNVYALGIGVYNNTNPVIKSISLFLLRFVDILTVRDFHSYDQVKTIKKARIYKDNSFLLPLLTKSAVKKQAFFKSTYNGHVKNIAFALKAPDTREESEKLRHSVIHFMEKYQRPATFWFYSLDSHGKEYGDMSFILSIAGNNDLQKRFRIIIVPDSLPAPLIFSSFQLMDLVVAMRFHGMVFSYRTNTPFIGIPYDAKCSSFLSSIGKALNSIEGLTRNGGMLRGA